MAEDETKRAFIICPFGKKGSPERLRSDDIFESLIKPACKAEGYYAYRTLDESRPGEITERMIEDLQEADLVIADLSAKNPNVFYELAIRHTTGLPFILMSDDVDSVPFDVGTLAVVEIKHDNFTAVRETTSELIRHIQQVKSGKADFSNPVFRYNVKKQVSQSGDPTDRMILELQDEVRNLSRRLNLIYDSKQNDEDSLTGLSKYLDIKEKLSILGRKRKDAAETLNYIDKEIAESKIDSDEIKIRNLERERSAVQHMLKNIENEKDQLFLMHEAYSLRK